MYDCGERYGIRQTMDIIRDKFRLISFEYFDPPIER